ACAVKAIGGASQGRPWPQADDEKQRAADAGLDAAAVLNTDDLVAGDNSYFVATGITDGDLLGGVRYARGRVYTNSLVMRSKSGTIRTISAEHRQEKTRAYVEAARRAAQNDSRLHN